MWTARFSADIRQMIGEGDLVVTLKTFSGTHEVESSVSRPPAGE